MESVAHRKQPCLEVSNPEANCLANDGNIGAIAVRYEMTICRQHRHTRSRTAGKEVKFSAIADKTGNIS